ncbi:hypothetical protein GGD65_003197 [Bradyrhizobium sp. CIR18]|uniref:hypothetical protein n=1 Tax=Bradyrhizobium sp. CIR18 TaxID=2663839 RepID=UPI001605DB7F|nr:hypothetical protein [Bradyrhizobium sp. CIR18]MBB4362172.1 hypothetical protein [Bradyrhizobium sp. CIR18]
MKASLQRRIALLEQDRSNGHRQMHFVKAIDQSDSDRQVAELIASGVASRQDGFLCLTGKRPDMA